MNDPTPLWSAMHELAEAARLMAGRPVSRGAKPSAETLKKDRLRRAVGAFYAACPEIPATSPSLAEMVLESEDAAWWATFRLVAESAANPPRTAGEVHDLIAVIMREAIHRMHRKDHTP